MPAPRPGGEKHSSTELSAVSPCQCAGGSTRAPKNAWLTITAGRRTPSLIACQPSGQGSDVASTAGAVAATSSWTRPGREPIRRTVPGPVEPGGCGAPSMPTSCTRCPWLGSMAIRAGSSMPSSHVARSPVPTMSSLSVRNHRWSVPELCHSRGAPALLPSTAFVPPRPAGPPRLVNRDGGLDLPEATTTPTLRKSNAGWNGRSIRGR